MEFEILFLDISSMVLIHEWCPPNRHFILPHRDGLCLHVTLTHIWIATKGVGCDMVDHLVLSPDLIDLRVQKLLLVSNPVSSYVPRIEETAMYEEAFFYP